MKSNLGSDEIPLLVSVVHCAGDDLEHVRYLGPEIRAHAGSITVPQEAELPNSWHLAFFHADGKFQAFGIGQRAKRVSDLDARFNLLSSRRLSHPEPVSKYRLTLGRILTDGRKSGTLPDRVTESFLSLFERSNSAEAVDLAAYRDWIEAQTLSGDQAKQLGLEKDVLLTLFDIANLHTGVLTDWSSDGITEESTFLDGLPAGMPTVMARPEDAAVNDRGDSDDSGFEKASAPMPRTERSGSDMTREARALQGVGINPFPRDIGQSVLEDDIIVSDMFSTPGLQREADVESRGLRYAQWHRFQNKSASQVLHVMYANRGRVEKDAGVDLVYYNESHKSYVCVQYKVMVQHPKNGWEYRPDKGLRKELRRMEQLDADYGDSATWFDNRLYPLAGFVKLCQQEVIRPASAQMTEGIYLTSSQTRALLRELDERPHGSGKTLHKDSVGRHLSNSMFVELVKAGHIGSVGRGFESVSELLKQAQEKGRRVIVAAHKQGR